MANKVIVTILFLSFLFLSILPMPSIISNDLNEEKELFKQEIILSVFSDIEIIKQQTIDIKINFSNKCWALNENKHSVKVFYEENGINKELESQIYDLDHIDKETIKSCNIIFIIPEETSSKGRFFVYYNSELEISSSHPDHVSINEDYFIYEPLLGYSLESWHYIIKEEENIIYTITQKGSAHNEQISQQVTKLKSNTKDYSLQNIDQTCSFSLVFWNEHEGKDTMSSTSEVLISKEILIDGNLMVRCKIISQSSNGYFQTEAVYTYYYRPTEKKGIHAKIKHELIKNPLSIDQGLDLFYATLSNFDIKSSSFPELNSGWIAPYMHVYSQDERRLVYDLDSYPDNSWQAIINKKDDCNLGSIPWVSLDEGKTGKAYGLILDSPDILLSGVDENNGVEVQAFEGKLKGVQFLRINARFVNIFLGRNTYEPPNGLDNTIPDDLSVKFNAEFFSTSNGGYPEVEKEALIFQSFYNNYSKIIFNETDFSFPISSNLNDSYLKLKINIADILALNPESSLKLILTTNDFDSHVELTAERLIDNNYLFTNLYPANYTIKIFYKSDVFEKHIYLSENQTISVVFPVLHNVTIKAFDSHGNPLNNAKVVLVRKGKKLEETTNQQGIASFLTPPGTYSIKIFTDNTLVAERSIYITNDKSISIVTEKNPMISFVIFTIIFSLVMISAYIGFKKRKIMNLIKVVAILLIVLSLFSPWWVSQGHSNNSEIETSTNLYFSPTKLVSITSSPDVISGEIVPLPELFLNVMSIVLVLIVFSCILLIGSMFIKKLNNNKFSLVLILCSLIILVSSICIIYYGLNELSSVGFGSLVGEDNIDVLVPGENSFYKVYRSWGPGLGFYLCLFSVAIVFLIFSFECWNNCILRKKKINIFNLQS